MRLECRRKLQAQSQSRAAQGVAPPQVGGQEGPAVVLEPKLQKEYRVAREHFNVEDIRLTTVNGTGAVCGQRKTFPRIVSCS